MKLGVMKRWLPLEPLLCSCGKAKCYILKCLPHVTEKRWTIFVGFIGKLHFGIGVSGLIKVSHSNVS